MNKLYVVAGSRNITNGLVEYANVGMTYKDRPTEERLKDVDYNRKKGGGNWVYLGEWELGDHEDREVHKILESKGFPKDPENTGNTEEFRFNRSKEEIHEIISESVMEVKHGVSSRLNDFGMRPAQQECHDAVLKAFSDGHRQFLIGAIMRFGKTFVSYQIMKSLGSNLTIVATYKTNDVVKAWKDEINNHVNFIDYRFVNIKDCTPEDFKSNQKTVVFVSVPYLLNDTGARDKNWIYDLNPDLLIVDEQHYGSNTIPFKKIVERFNPKKRIDLSGTPYKAYLRGSYPEECIYRWDKLPIKMNLFSIDLAKDVVENLESAGFIEEDGFNINKFFSAGDNGFIFHADVEAAMKKIFGINPFERNKHLFSPICIREIEDKKCLDHILLRLENVSSAIAMEKMLESMLPEYTIIRAAGQDSGAIKKADQLQSLISRSTKSITITVGRFETGITIPRWGSVFALHGGSSPESYFQTAYRASSECNEGDRNKKCFYVFDFDPSRCFEVLYVSRAISKKSGESLSSSFDDFFDCANVYAVENNKFAPIDAQEVIKHFENVLSKRDPASEIRSEYGMNNLRLSGKSIMALTDISASKAKHISIAMTKNDLPKGKIKKRAATVGLNSEQKETINKLIEKMKTVCSRIPIVIITKDYVDLSSLLEDTDNNDYFKEVTGVYLSDYAEMIETGALGYEWQDRAIIRIHNITNAIKPEVY